MNTDKPTRNKRTSSYRGIYVPKNPQKYVGNVNNIVYRSLWERKYMVFCDTRENIIKWSSEELAIPYKSPLDGRVHRYFPDFIVEVKDTDGKVTTYVVEIKPQKQTVKPKTPQRQTRNYLYEMAEYHKNQAKWEAAKEFCRLKKFEFKIITEAELGIKK
jgi:hypothetical protein